MVWVQYGQTTLKNAKKEDDLYGKLNDLVINCSQRMLQNQFPMLNGLVSCLFFNSNWQPSFGKWKGNFLQICHFLNDHWMTVATVNCMHGEILIYVSFYNALDSKTMANLESLYGLPLRYKMANTQKQRNGKDYECSQ